MADEETIQSVYDSPSGPGAFLSSKKIHKVLQQSGTRNIGIHRIRKWLQKQNDYSLQKPVRRHFQRVKVVVSDINEQWDMDLADMQSLAKENDKIRYLLVAIDIFSRFARVYPLKDKTGKSVANALETMFATVHPQKVRTDAGTEFKNALVRKIFHDRNIYHHIALNDVKANYVERLNKSLKSMIFRYLARNRTKRYLDILPKLVQSYNATPHRGINLIAPRDVKKEISADLWAYMYLKPRVIARKNSRKNIKSSKKLRKKNILYRYKIGQLVRLAHQRKPFTKLYNEQWTYEVFKISKRFQMQSIPLYQLVDLLGDSVLGNFYQAELQAVDQNENTLFEIEKIVKTRKINRTAQYLVKWVGYSDKFNSWVNKSDVKVL